MQCSGFIEILDMIISGPTELKTYWIWSNSKHSIKYTHLAISFLLTVSPQNSPQQSATAEGFAKASSVFIVITSAKILPRCLFGSKICILFTIFNTYFLTKLLLTNQDITCKCLYVLQEVRSLIFLTAYSSSFFWFTWQ